MRRSGLFWGLILTLFGVLLLLENFGLLGNYKVMEFWPVVLIFLGIWILWGAFTRRAGKSLTTHAVVSLEGASQARLSLKHGAGRVGLKAADLGDTLLEGKFNHEIEVETEREGDTIKARLRSQEHDLPLDWNTEGLEWDLTLNRAVPYQKIKLAGGANRADLDLSELRVAKIELQTGASNTTLHLPAQGHTRLEGEMGAATLKLIIPAGVAGRVAIGGGLMTLHIDSQRFPRQGDEYVSPDFATNPNRVEIQMDAGAATINVE